MVVPPDLVRMKDGGMVRGTILELVSDEFVTIVVDGKQRRFSMADVSYAGPARGEPTAKAERAERVEDKTSTSAAGPVAKGEATATARPFVTVHAGEARLKLTAAEQGTTFHLRSGEVMGMGLAAGRAIAVRSFSYPHLHSSLRGVASDGYSRARAIDAGFHASRGARPRDVTIAPRRAPRPFELACAPRNGHRRPFLTVSSSPRRDSSPGLGSTPDTPPETTVACAARSGYALTHAKAQPMKGKTPSSTQSEVRSGRSFGLSAKDKLRAVVETLDLEGDALGEYLRQREISREQLEQWRFTAIAALERATAKAAMPAAGAMPSNIVLELQSDPAKWERCKGYFRVLDLPAKTTLLREGQIARSMYIVKAGCLRLWFNKDGKAITFQFFFESQAVSSLESFLSGEPSPFSLETVEPTRVVAIRRKDWDALYELYPDLRDVFVRIILKRMEDYGRLFLSRIKDSPRERYEALLRDEPETVRRIPQHFIASYLGITPVSLSRIRRRICTKR